MILLGTTNPGKIREFQEIFDGGEFEIKSLKDFPEISPIEEIGETFKEAALHKARIYFEQTGLPVVTDDGGLMVDALGGAPGVKSHRWLGENVSWVDLAKGVVERMKGKENRAAQLGSVVVFYDGNEPLISSKFVDGEIIEELDGDLEPGFPYRAIFIVKEFNKLFRDLTDEEHEAVNHRRWNVEQLKPEILARLASK